MKKSLMTLLIGFIAINAVGCASEHRLAKPKGKWIEVNQPVKVENPVNSNNANGKQPQSKIKSN